MTKKKAEDLTREEIRKHIINMKTEDKIYFEIITQDTRKVFLDKTIEILRSFTNR